MKGKHTERKKLLQTCVYRQLEKKNGGICSFAVRSFRDSGYTDARDRLRSDVL